MTELKAVPIWRGRESVYTEEVFNLQVL